MRGKTQEFLVLDQPASAQPVVSDDDGLHLVEQIIDAFAERYTVEVETVAAVEENMFFPLPRPLRGLNVDAA